MIVLMCGVWLLVSYGKLFFLNWYLLITVVKLSHRMFFFVMIICIIKMDVGILILLFCYDTTI